MYKDKTVSILAPIFNQYKLIPQFLDALIKSTVIPDCVVYFDNGLHIQDFLKEDNYPFKFEIYQPEKNMGTATAWNYMIKNISEERIVLNDDIFLYPDTIQKMIDTEGEVVACSKISGINAFSCFLIRDSAIDKVGYFDELISPNYCYFEDNDYVYRMKLLGLEVQRADCGAEHYNGGSQSIKGLSESRMQEHHLKFNYAKKRYIAKWGGEPGYEIYTKPYNKD